MKTEQLIYTTAGGWKSDRDLQLRNSAQLVFIFGNRDLLKNEELIAHIKTTYPGADLAGCSTSGEICQENVFDDHLICTAVEFENTHIEVVAHEVLSMDQSYNAGSSLAARLKKDNLRHVLVISEGLNINGSELTKGFNAVLENKVAVSGGLAGDQAYFSETVIVHNTTGRPNLVLAIGFYGETIKVGYGSMGGWDAFGVDREVTRSEKNILYELDGQPALGLYKKYLGDYASQLPSSALLFPISLTLEDGISSVVRTILSVNEANGSMVFAGDIPQGSNVRLMKASFDRLIDGASDAAEMSSMSLRDSNPDLAILISCVGRKLVLKQRVEEELEAIRTVLGPQAVMTGFYSYGEICPMKPFEQHCELHNQTMTITVFKE